VDLKVRGACRGPGERKRKEGYNVPRALKSFGALDEYKAGVKGIIQAEPTRRKSADLEIGAIAGEGGKRGG
jgi:hypothetical protein